MYGKVFESMYDGTLRGHWQAIVTMQQLVVLATPDGVVDMTPEAIAGRTSIPLAIIKAGLKHLADPDPFTRTPGEEGRRIVLLDDHRPWGWRLVNHAKYRALRDHEQKREADRLRQSKKRNEDKGVASTSRDVAKVAHTDTDTDAGKEGKASSGETPDVQSGQAKRKEARAIAECVLAYLNQKAGTKYRPTEAHLRLMVGRVLQDQATEVEMKAVVDLKVAEWGTDPERRRFLSPDTLFNATKYGKYAGQISIGQAPAAKLEVKVYAERADGARELVITYQANGLGAEAAARQVLAQHRKRFDQFKAKNIVLDNGRNVATFSIAELS